MQLPDELGLAVSRRNLMGGYSELLRRGGVGRATFFGVYEIASITLRQYANDEVVFP